MRNYFHGWNADQLEAVFLKKNEENHRRQDGESTGREEYEAEA